MVGTFERLERRRLLSAEGVTIEITRLNNIADVFVVYNQSAFDDNTPTVDVAKDGSAIATDKMPLTIGETATPANYTSYAEGVNAVAIDVFEVPDDAVIDATDFVFRVGNSDYFNTWDAAPQPAEIVVAEDAGRYGADRVFLRWENGAVQNAWLQITVLPEDFDLQPWFEFDASARDTFFFGNLIGETTGDFVVNQEDVYDVIWPLLFTADPIGVDHPADVNRDRRIDYDDVFDVVWPNLSGSPLVAITPSATDPVMNDRIALASIIRQIQSQQREEEEERFEEFAGIGES